MAERRIKRALISVYDKTGIVDFARALVDEFGVEIISTGGTAALLKENGIPVTLVEQITGFPEMLDGRVKTLHPKIHAAILADRDNPEHMRQLKEQGIEPIDMVVVNLYPFEKTVADRNCTFEQAIEMIDIGGPCLLRAAAKNYRHVVPILRKEGLSFVLEELRENGKVLETRRVVLASIVYQDISAYDAKVDAYLAGRWTELRCGPSDTPGSVDPNSVAPDRLCLCMRKVSLCQYGENPHQRAALYRSPDSPIRLRPVDPRSPIPSFNNYVDADAALQLCRELTVGGSARAACVFVKHTNPCGAGLGTDRVDVYRRAYWGDPNAAMGGILTCSFPVSESFAAAVMETYDRWGKGVGAGGFFAEVWIAPQFDEPSVELIRNHKKSWGAKVRLLSMNDFTAAPDAEELHYHRIAGGMLVQTPDVVGLNEDQWKVVTRRSPSESEISDLRLAWLIAKHTKSNAISVCKDGMLIGNGAGQMSRVMSCRIATWLAKENGHADKLPGSVAASDAFFPFADGPNILIDAGVTAIIQPGGSKRDAEVIAACDARNVGMIFTGTRHFKH
jgi:phosphoribosylaminoimidazolecarboxamide formyltransferase/IMP cyclohydrolase